MLASVPHRTIRDLQSVIQAHGKSVQYYESGGAPAGRSLKARVRYLNAQELANAIENYAIRVTLDARDFASRAPAKGDTVLVDEARRGVLSVAEIHVGEELVAYACGVQG
jgi:hypothetical protein